MSKRPPPRRRSDGEQLDESPKEPLTDSPANVDDAAHSNKRATGLSKKTSPQQPRDASRSMPIESVSYALYGLILIAGWCAMANSYHSATVGRPEVVETSNDAISGLLMVVAMVWTFVKSSIVYLASLPAVIEHTLSEAIIIPVGMLIAGVGVYLFVQLTDKVERDIEKGFERSKHRRSAHGEWSSRTKRRRK